MYWGQFIDTTSREVRSCAYCIEEIPKGDLHYGLVVRTKASRFTRHLHQGCLFPFVEAAREERKTRIREARKARPGRVRLELTDEQRSERKRLQEYIWDDKRRLLLAYGSKKPKKIASAKALLLARIQKIESTGEPYWFKFGFDLLGLLRDGADPSIPYIEALRADTEDRQLGKQLLAVMIEAPSESHPRLGQDYSEMLREIEQLLAQSLAERRYDDAQQHFRSLGEALLQAPVKYKYTWCVELDRQLGPNQNQTAFKYVVAEIVAAHKKDVHTVGNLFINISERKSQ